MINKEEYPYVNPWSSKMSARLEYLDYNDDIKTTCEEFWYDHSTSFSNIFIICSEVLKVITNKFNPIKQWYTWHDSFLLENEFDCTKGSSKLENLMGTDFVRKLDNLEITIFGYESLGKSLVKFVICSRIGINSKNNVVLNKQMDDKKLNDKLNF